MGYQITAFLVARDIYTQPVGVNYRGSDVFQTKLGAFFTFVTYLVMMFNFTTLMQAFFDGSRQSVSSVTTTYDRYSEGKFSLGENSIRINILDYDKPLTPDIGRYRFSKWTTTGTE